MPAWRWACCTTLPVGVDADGADAWALGRRARRRRERRGAAGQLHSTRPGLGTAALAAGPAGRHRLRRAAGHAARRAGPRRRPADRPRRRAVAAVVDPARRRPGPRHLRALRRRRDARGAGTGSPSGRSDRVGEDLGTVEPEVTEALADNGMLGCAVSWFTRDESAPDEPLLPPAKWPARAAASLSTHDLPTAAGFLRGEHVRARAELGLLDDVPAEQAAAAQGARRVVGVAALRGPAALTRGQATPEPDEATIIAAMHRFLAATPSRLKLVSPYDVRRPSPGNPTCPARSTNTRTGGSRCRRPSSNCAPTRGSPRSPPPSGPPVRHDAAPATRRSRRRLRVAARYLNFAVRPTAKLPCAYAGQRASW